MVIFFLLLSVPFGLYWQATGFELVWDDMSLHLRHLVPPGEKELWEFWQGPIDKQYAPVTFSVWALLVKLFPGASSSTPNPDAFVLHLANIVVHILVGLMVFWLLYNLIRHKWAALIGALFFSVHPIQVHTVAWVSEMRGLLGTLLGLGSLILYLQSNHHLAAKPGNHRLKYLAGMALLALSMASKPASIILPLFALVVEVGLFRTPLRRSLVRLAPGFLLMIPFALVTIAGQEKYSHFKIEIPFWTHPLIWMDTINFYLYKIINPTRLAVSYDRTPLSLIQGTWLYIGWIIPVVLAVSMYGLRKKHPIVAAAGLLFVIGYLPTSGLVAFPFQAWSTVSDRYVYLSMFPVSLVLAYLLQKIAHRYLTLGAFALIGLLAAQSFWIQIPSWKDGLTLWNHCLLVTPTEARAYKQRGNMYGQKGNLFQASRDINKALELDPDFPKAYVDRAVIEIKTNQLEAAMSDLDRAISLDPTLKEAYLNRATILMEFGRLDDAVADLSRVLELDPRSAAAYRMRAKAHQKAGRPELAKQDHEKMKQLGVNPPQEGNP